MSAKSADAWGKDFATWLYRENALELFKSPSAGAVSKPGESEADFRARLQQEAREGRDAEADRLRQKYAAKLASLQERLRRAEQTVGREKQESMQAGVQTAISVGRDRARRPLRPQDDLGDDHRPRHDGGARSGTDDEAGRRRRARPGVGGGRPPADSGARSRARGRAGGPVRRDRSADRKARARLRAPEEDRHHRETGAPGLAPVPGERAGLDFRRARRRGRGCRVSASRRPRA